MNRSVPFFHVHFDEGCQGELSTQRVMISCYGISSSAALGGNAEVFERRPTIGKSEHLYFCLVITKCSCRYPYAETRSLKKQVATI